jgi:hypothetical protein
MKIEPSVFTDASLVDGELVFDKDITHPKADYFDFDELKLGRYKLKKMPDTDPSSRFIYLNGKKVAVLTVMDGTFLRKTTSIYCRWVGFVVDVPETMHGEYFVDTAQEVGEYVRSFLAKTTK